MNIITWQGYMSSIRTGHSELKTKKSVKFSLWNMNHRRGCLSASRIFCQWSIFCPRYNTKWIRGTSQRVVITCVHFGFPYFSSSVQIYDFSCRSNHIFRILYHRLSLDHNNCDLPRVTTTTTITISSSTRKSSIVINIDKRLSCWYNRSNRNTKNFVIHCC